MSKVRSKFDFLQKSETIEERIVPKIKYVRKASQWCKTYFKSGKQIQEWYPTKEEAQSAPIKD